MTDKHRKRRPHDPTTTSSFENAAVTPDPEGTGTGDATGEPILDPILDPIVEPDTGAAIGERTMLGEEAALVSGALGRALEQQLAEAKEKHVRLYAEFDNFRRRATRERQEAELRGMGNLVRGILDTLDDLTRFAHVDPASTDAKTVVEGVDMVERKLLKSLGGHGLEVVNPVGEPFDPAWHEAITTAPAATPDEDHLIAQVFQVGYRFNGTLLRPARVVVKQWNG